MNRIRRKIRKPADTLITGEQRAILLAKKEEPLKLLIALKQPGLAKNISYLRKTVKKQDGEQQVEVRQEPEVQGQSRLSTGRMRSRQSDA